MAIKGLALAIPIPGAKKGGKDDESPKEESEGGSSGKLAACEDMISAFKRSDPKALMAALDDYHALSSVPSDEADEEADY